MAPGSRMVGMAQIRAGSAEMVADPALALHVHADRIEDSAAGDLAYAQGTYRIRMTNLRTHRPFDDHGSYVTTTGARPTVRAKRWTTSPRRGDAGLSRMGRERRARAVPDEVSARDAAASRGQSLCGKKRFLFSA